MTLVALIDLLRMHALDVLGIIAQASFEGAIVAAVVWGACRLLPAMPAAVRAWLWWLVSVKLLLGLLPVPVVQIPWLPASVPAWTAPAPADLVPLPLAPPSPRPDPGAAAAPAASVPPAPTPSSQAPQPVSIPYVALWPVALALGWVAIASVQLLGLVRAWRDARRLVRHAAPVPGTIARRAMQLVQRFALPVVPDVLASRLSAVPLLTGVLRPAILLPAASTDSLSRAELDLVLGHELAHVRRGDLVWGWLPALAARLFFFHPLARLATREYLAAREEACDAEVLQTLDAAPADYGQLLVKLGVAPIDDVLAAAGTSPTFASLKRRLIMLDRSRTPASRWWWTLAGATAVLVPLTLVAQPVTEAVAASADSARGGGVAQDLRLADLPEPPLPPPRPEPPPAADDIEDDDVPPLPPAPPLPPTPPLPPEPPPDEAQEHRHEGHRRIQSPWVLLEPGAKNVMSGSTEDRAEAERNRTSDSDTLLWFRYQGNAYVTRDTATIAAVRQAFEPVNVTARKMGELGGTQGRIGGEQGTLGAKQGELGARQAALAAEMTRLVADRLAAQAERMRAQQTARAALSADEEKDLEARRDDLEKQMRTLGEQQRELGEQMRALGDKMRVEGRALRQMGRTLQDELAAADAAATSIFGAAVANGKATPAK